LFFDGINILFSAKIYSKNDAKKERGAINAVRRNQKEATWWFGCSVWRHEKAKIRRLISPVWWQEKKTRWYGNPIRRRVQPLNKFRTAKF
jgi:hypothetical protein